MSLACKGGGALACELENMQSACSLIEFPNYSLLGTHMVAWLVAGQQVHRAAARQGVEGDCAGTALSLLPGGFLFSRSPFAAAPACCPLQELAAGQRPSGGRRLVLSLHGQAGLPLASFCPGVGTGRVSQG